MRLIKSSVEQIKQKKGLTGIKKQIEIAGRTCYKSENKITNKSCEEFVQRMINSGHTAMLEHGTVYLTVPTEDANNGYKYSFNKYSKVNFDPTGKDTNIYVTTNYRVICENKWEDDLKYLTEPTNNHEKRLTFCITCDRITSQSIVRHRVMSFAQESTRYCNYAKDKFNNEITYVIPTWLEDKLPEGQYVEWDGDWCDIEKFTIQHPIDNSVENEFVQALQNSEYSYMYFIENGWKPQQARSILPNALKTEMIVTGFMSDWLRFIAMRTAPNAHPDIQKLANILLTDKEIKKYIITDKKK
nr:MAG TPA: Thymidylate synthase complementing protein [Bacteriophage sp.]